jgi:hypothetical protein
VSRAFLQLVKVELAAVPDHHFAVDDGVPRQLGCGGRGYVWETTSQILALAGPQTDVGGLLNDDDQPVAIPLQFVDAAPQTSAPAGSPLPAVVDVGLEAIE